MASIKDLLSPMDEQPTVVREKTGQRENRNELTTTQRGSAAETTHFTIEFILDTICPHCYIGLRSLNTAIEIYRKQHPEAAFEVTCSPMVLNPHAARSAHNKQEYYVFQRKYPPSRLVEWSRLGDRVGIDFSWKGLTGNTRDSHKLLRLALEGSSTTTTRRSTAFASQGTSTTAPSTARIPDSTTSTTKRGDGGDPGFPGPQMQIRLLEIMYHDYFEKDQDLSSQAWLVDVGSRVLGLPPAEVRACLESDERDCDMTALLDDVRDRGFYAIPQFILQGRYLAGGWQEPDLFLEVFERIRVSGGTDGGVSVVPCSPAAAGGDTGAATK
ncbi:DSBA-like thioredoxin domain protein, partial [Apiospora phragmitis]